MISLHAAGRMAVLIGSGIGVLAQPKSVPAADTGPDVSALLRSSVCVTAEGAKGEVSTSGFVVPPGNRVLTTAHGLQGTETLRVTLADDRVFRARIERLEEEPVDLAILRVEGARLPSARLGSVSDLTQGDAILAITCPADFPFSVTRGVVSAIRPVPGLDVPVIQTDVAVSPGSSGGPLFGSDGRVVGIVKNRAEDRDRIHFALPIDLGRSLLGELEQVDRAHALFRQAVREERKAEKVELYRSAVQLAPDLAEARFNLALTFEEMGRMPEAEQEYREAIRLQPGFEEAALNLGALLHAQGRYEEGIDVYRRTLERLARSVRLRNNLAESYRAAGKPVRAEREFLDILGMNETYAPAHYGLALLYDGNLDRPERAVEHYRRYLALVPDAPDAERITRRVRSLEEKGS